mmetsp:Transcript_884/g.1833  ORF Transcript_884/g.1833 Transcript_884/m.1833 type:complete len:211 (-) Transcript_884:196-828(-)
MPGFPSIDVDDDASCRICWGGVGVGEMTSPCDCRGSSANVHLECLQRWTYKQIILCRDSWRRCPTCAQMYEDATCAALANCVSAQCLSQRGMLHHAEAPLRFVYRYRCTTLGLDHPHTLRTLNQLAKLLLKHGRCNEAKQLFLREPPSKPAVKTNAKVTRPAKRFGGITGRPGVCASGNTDVQSRIPSSSMKLVQLRSIYNVQTLRTGMR